MGVVKTDNVREKIACLVGLTGKQFFIWLKKEQNAQLQSFSFKFFC